MPIDSILEAFTADLKQAPLPPDYEWGPADFMTLRTTPPADVASRFVVRGSTVVFTDELGITTRLTTTLIEGQFAPQVAVSIQNTDGTVTPLDPAAQAQTLRVISKLEDEVQERGGRLVQHVTREWGWFNPRAGKLRTPAGGEGPGPVEDGFYWLKAYLDEQGEYRAWPGQAFVQVGERREVPLYDFTGTVLGVDTTVLTWHGRVAAVREVGAATPNLSGAAVGSDGQSYRSVDQPEANLVRIDELEVSEASQVRYEFDEATGAARIERQKTWGWYSPRTAIEGNPWFLRYDGTGQRNPVALWNQVTGVTNTNYLTGDKLLAGTSALNEAWFAPKRINGAYNWGDFRSDALIERFGPVKREIKYFNVLSEDTFEEVEPATGKPPKLIVGRLPVPRFRASTWTTIVQQPLELVLEDSTVEAWFGFSREVITNDYLQDLDEAAAWLGRRRRRMLSHKHELVRPFASARPGDTVLLADPRRGLAHRCLVAKLRESWTIAPQTRVVFTYSLEQPL